MDTLRQMLSDPFMLLSIVILLSVAMVTMLDIIGGESESK